MVTCAFWGMMHFGKVLVSSCLAFNTSKYLKHQDAFFGLDLDKKHYMRLDLPSAKTAKLGEIQSILKVIFAHSRHSRTCHT